jgi:hypothetical protein
MSGDWGKKKKNPVSIVYMKNLKTLHLFNAMVILHGTYIVCVDPVNLVFYMHLIYHENNILNYEAFTLISCMINYLI